MYIIEDVYSKMSLISLCCHFFLFSVAGLFLYLFILFTVRVNHNDVICMYKINLFYDVTTIWLWFGQV